jgi:thiamine-phosphate pyrophosphorylase
VSLGLEQPIICLITRGEAAESNFAAARRQILEITRIAVDEKISFIQIREKRLSARLLFELAGEVVDLTRGSQTRVLVNDRADIALAAKADGVHLAANSLRVGVIRKSFPKDLIVGVSTHTLESVVDAAEQGADLALFGPVFETPGKGAPRGLATLSEVCGRVWPFPVVALGGIDEFTCAPVLRSGASGFAAIRSLNDPGSLRSIASKLRK